MDLLCSRKPPLISIITEGQPGSGCKNSMQVYSRKVDNSKSPRDEVRPWIPGVPQRCLQDPGQVICISGLQPLPLNKGGGWCLDRRESPSSGISGPHEACPIHVRIHAVIYTSVHVSSSPPNKKRGGNTLTSIL